jgi:hypothetical protein
MIKSLIFLIISIFILLAFIAFSTHIMAFIVFPVAFFTSFFLFTVFFYLESIKE